MQKSFINYDKTLINQQIHTNAVCFFLYLNRHCYNGLCRYNSKGEYNVPFWSLQKPYFPEDELIWFSEKAQKPYLSAKAIHQP